MLTPRCTKVGVIKYIGKKGYLSSMEMLEIVGGELDKGVKWDVMDQETHRNVVFC